MKTDKPQQVEPARTKSHRKNVHRTNKNTIFDVYKYQNSDDWSIIRHTGTKLLQSFTYLDYQFEVRLSRDEQTVFVCTDSLIYSRTTSVAKVKAEISKNEKWYLQLNWSDAPENITGEMAEKREFLAEYEKR